MIYSNDLQLCAQFLQLRVLETQTSEDVQGRDKRGRGSGELTKVNRYFHFLKRSLHSTTSTHSIHFSLHASRSTHWVDGVPFDDDVESTWSRRRETEGRLPWGDALNILYTAPR